VSAGRFLPSEPQAGQRGRGWFALVCFILLSPVLVFAAMVGVDRALGSPASGRDYALRFDLPRAETEVGLPPIAGPADPSRPLVVIDAGHGGHDPGAGDGPVKEKDITLMLARALRQRLLEQGGIRVALTRDTDRYLLLEDRSGIARRLHANLFVSIHADSSETGTATGATVYTLSDRGSSQEAEKLAVSQNRADIVNGVALSRTSSAVSAILVDLSQRHAARQSEEFARLILREAEGRIAFRDRPIQSAAFVVLKSPDLPSVLFEAGYVSNSEDFKRLGSREGRDAFADVTAQAIRVYFARQAAGVLADTPRQGPPAP